MVTSRWPLAGLLVCSSSALSLSHRAWNRPVVPSPQESSTILPPSRIEAVSSPIFLLLHGAAAIGELADRPAPECPCLPSSKPKYVIAETDCRFATFLPRYESVPQTGGSNQGCCPCLPIDPSSARKYDQPVLPGLVN